MEELHDKINGMKTKADFVEFVKLLLKDLEDNNNEWENPSLERYLDAVAAWTEDMDGYYQNQNLPIPQNVDWKVFANILMAAKIYE